MALKHGGIVHSTIAQAYKKLSRLDEYTCDRIGRKLVGDPAIAQQGLVLLTVGHHLLRFVNPQELLNQANEVAANKQSKKAEKKLTHPLLFHRIHRIITESKED